MPSADVISVLRTLNNPWLGYRYTILSMPEGLSFKSVVDAAGLASLGITEVTLPTIEINMFEVPSLSTKRDVIPIREQYSELVLKAPTFRNTAFWDRIEGQIKSLSDPSTYDSLPETIIISEYDTGGNASQGLKGVATGLGIVTELTPIAVWICSGCQAKSYSPAPASTLSTGSVPLEELRMQVQRLERL